MVRQISHREKTKGRSIYWAILKDFSIFVDCNTNFLWGGAPILDFLWRSSSPTTSSEVRRLALAVSSGSNGHGVMYICLSSVLIQRRYYIRRRLHALVNRHKPYLEASTSLQIPGGCGCTGRRMVYTADVESSISRDYFREDTEWFRRRGAESSPRACGPFSTARRINNFLVRM